MKLVQRLFSLPNAPSPTLRRLYVLRHVGIVGQALTVIWVDYGLGMPLPLAAMGAGAR